MSSSYIVRALFILIKLNIVFFFFFLPTAPPPTPTLKTALIAHVCDHHSASQENPTGRKGGVGWGAERGVYGQGRMRLLYAPLRNGHLKSCRVLTEIQYQMKE